MMAKGGEPLRCDREVAPTHASIIQVGAQDGDPGLCESSSALHAIAAQYGVAVAPELCGNALTRASCLHPSTRLVRLEGLLKVFRRKNCSRQREGKRESSTLTWSAFDRDISSGLLDDADAEDSPRPVPLPSSLL